MPKASILIQTEQGTNNISFSKNYRIFGHEDPIFNVVSLFSYSDSLQLGSNQESALTRKFRYSSNKYDWSLWYPFEVTAYDHLMTLPYESDKPLFVEVKIEYDNGTYDELTEQVIVDYFNLVFETNGVQPTGNYQFIAKASNEGSPAFVIDKLATFRPYAVNAANQLNIGMSYQTNIMFGHEVVYFRTLPKMNSGDFVFKEWTILDTVDKRCIKVMVPNNEFPDSKPKFNEFGIDFEVPFEIHIDNSYYQAIFGKGAEPRVRDYMYFPMMDRMYEIKSCYILKGFMMEPIYWKISLNKYQPSVDMKNEKYGDTINDIISSANELFGPKVEKDTQNVTLPGQLKTVSQSQDEARQNVDLMTAIVNFDKTYTYIPLIDRYYDMSRIQSSEQSFKVETVSAKNNTILTGNPQRVRAYEDSPLFTAWRSGFLDSFDLNVLGSNERHIRVEGPIDSHSDAGRYIDVVALNNLQDARERTILTTGTDVIFRGRANGVTYRANAALNGNITFSCLFNLKPNVTSATLLKGFSNGTGCIIKWRKTLVAEFISVQLNGDVTDFEIAPLTPNQWYGLIIPISSQFKQIGTYIYSFGQNLANIKDWNKMTPVFAEKKEVATVTDFTASTHWALPAGPYSITNIRIFKTIIQEEDHEFMLSQQIIRSGETLHVVDNCRQRIDSPNASLNR